MPGPGVKKVSATWNSCEVQTFFALWFSFLGTHQGLCLAGEFSFLFTVEFWKPAVQSLHMRQCKNTFQTKEADEESPPRSGRFVRGNTLNSRWGSAD